MTSAFAIAGLLSDTSAVLLDAEFATARREAIRQAIETSREDRVSDLHVSGASGLTASVRSSRSSRARLVHLVFHKESACGASRISLT